MQRKTNQTRINTCPTQTQILTESLGETERERQRGEERVYVRERESEHARERGIESAGGWGKENRAIHKFFHQLI